ncbi:DNA polymerase-3 subunit alpha [Chitinivorax tropicus]|uniref:DNA polymerase III subunit alpha n=1 Tax=Chitinivorax tropicus TaxID=714531 RepID=A0A840MRZ8_9PROT|nr:DNA polymerase III subunit alpha [Chitinivorax tropicus]MBB5020195.1 DNA polymerase-3 subunit alpha [Chitinivorax tropicus]
MNAPDFVHLRLHTEFSIQDGIVRIDDAVGRAKAEQMPALGISDLANMFGMLKFYKACRGKGIKPVIGCDVWIENDIDRDKPFRAMLICRDRAGYGRVAELLTQAYRTNQYRERAEIKRAWLESGDNRGVIVLSGAAWGDVGQALINGNLNQATEYANWWARLFPDAYYLELQRNGQSLYEQVLQGCLQLASELDLPVVATHPIQFMSREEFKAHEARVCIASGYVLADKRRPRDFTEDQYFKSRTEMLALFADVPEALANTVEIAKRCNVTIQLGKYFLPDFPTPDGMTLDDYLEYRAGEGLKERMLHLFPDADEREAKRPEYEARLKFETDTIIKMGFPGYFLIVADFINWGKNNGCPVGPGRGSGAGSLVAYSLGITDLDPLRYALLFERFLNPERVSMPDFDVDFCQDNRWRVIEYVRQKYGIDAVSQIITYGTMSSKAVIRDVGRVLDLPFGLCDRLSKLVPLEANKPVALAKAIEMEPQINEIKAVEEGVDELFELAQTLEDLTRGVGMHAGGVLIAPGRLTDFCPLYQAYGDEASPVSQFDKDDVEQIGLVKFDFLGLRTLTILELAVGYIKQLDGRSVDLAALPLDDQQAYQIFKDGNTTAVFQFESSGMKDMLKKAKPDLFEDIIAFVALYRPGPMDLIPDFIARKQGTKFEYLHPLLEPVLSATYGIMVYQEQVMQAAQVCGGYSLGGADLLRRAMGKKKVEEMVQQRATFVAGAAQKDISEEKANEIFDYMEKFAGYGFNKSHAAAYALVAYHTAWLKAHYCAAFMAATMSTELSNTDQLAVFREDLKLNRIELLSPDINKSVYRFVPESMQSIRYALGAIKGTGEAAIEHIVAEREANGPYKSLFDFCNRTDKRMVNRRVIEALIRGGAFDTVDDHRGRLLANVQLAIDQAEQKNANANQGGLFDMFEEAAPSVEMIDCPRWDLIKLLTEEKLAIGFYLSGHPFEGYAPEVRTFAKTKIKDLRPSKDPKDLQTLAGIVLEVRIKQTQRGRMAFVKLDDGSEPVDISVFSELFDASRNKIKEDALLVVKANVRHDEYSGGVRIIADSLFELAEARSQFAKRLALRMNGQADAGRLKQILSPYQAGACPVSIKYSNQEAECELVLGDAWRITLHDDLLNELKAWLGEQHVAVRYS